MTSPSAVNAPARHHGGLSNTAQANALGSHRSSGSGGTAVTLNTEIMGSLKPSRLFKQYVEAGKTFTSLSFDDKGDYLITTGEDETLNLFNCRTGKHVKHFFSKKYGCNYARFTHTNTSVIHSSTKEDHTIRYLSLHDNSYLRYFKGHKGKVTSLQMGPVDDTFLSAAADDSVKLWDLRTPNAQGSLTLPGHPSISYDPNGSIFAVTFAMQNAIMLYDLRQFDKAPFLAENIYDGVLHRMTGGFAAARIPLITGCRFSNNGLKILLGTAGNVHYILDAFQCTIQARLEGHTGLERMGQAIDVTSDPPRAGASGEELSWTPDGRYVMGGSLDGSICIWDADPPGSDHEAWAGRPTASPEATLRPVQQLDGHKGKPCRVLGFNPKVAMLATGGNELAFWLPDREKGP